MLIKRVRRMIEKNRDDIFGILLRKYPGFILNDRAYEPVGIPSFVFHAVTRESLGPMLHFLADNDYESITADEYFERRMRGEKGGERAVLLTFDDGDRSLYTVAYPLLKQFGLKAVAYIIPGMTPEGGRSGDTPIWEKSFCNWEEIKEMHESGLIDIQSHSMYHHTVPVSNRVVDFVREARTSPYTESYLAYFHDDKEDRRKSFMPAHGTPVYEGKSRFDKYPAFRDSPKVRASCVEYVENSGGVDYFKSPAWRHRLKDLITEIRQRGPAFSFESEADQRSAILKDFLESKAEIERRLPGKRVRHFCFPWYKGSAAAAQLSAEAGYVSNAWGFPLPGFIHNGQSPLPIPRLLPPYLFRLPGKNRKTFTQVLKMRLSELKRRRLRGNEDGR